MAEPTGSYTYSSFFEAICLEAGWDLYGGTSDDQNRQASWLINRAVQEYYNSHEWTFLNKYHTFATVAGTQDYDCPDDFGNVLEGDAGMISFPSIPSTPWPPVTCVPEHQWRYYIQVLRNLTTFPSVYCIVPKTQAGAAGQRFQVRFWPVPNQVWNPMTYQYRVVTNELSASNPYILGTNIHAMAIMNLCLAQACGSITRDLQRQEYFRGLAMQQMEQNKVNDGLNRSAVIPNGGGMVGGYSGGAVGAAIGINGRLFGAGAGWPVPFLQTGQYFQNGVYYPG